MASDVVRVWTVEEFFADLEPPTVDDAPITASGRVLDSPDQVIGFLDDLDRRRARSED